MSIIISKLISEKYNITKSDFLGSGMEAKVFAYENDKVLKWHKDRSNVTKQNSLRRFYQSMNTDGLSYELPCIYDIIQEKDSLITIEKRIKGRDLQSLLSQMDNNQLNEAMKTYLSANIELKSVKMEANFEGYSLFNDYGISLAKLNNWFELLKELILIKQLELDHYFHKDVVNYKEKLKVILEILSKGYKGDYSLIHGDFYPGNVLIENGGVTGVIDFGLMTMYGDYLFDVAIGWVCFDMYDELDANIRERYLKIILENLGENVRSSLYLYVLVFSSISANLYSKNCKDGHYRWCVENLNNEQYWNAIK
ncbi:MAG: aminoglycoside phosphotransferase family protein [Melioribacteraceae bacterium]|nr:aminoglycoside phosphotransferase family protein [Melioribacteraceae bacterium]